MRKIVILLLLLASVAFPTHLFAQGKISGKVIDRQTGSSVEYATIAVLNAKDSSLVTGTVTEGNGSFAVKIAYGRYLVRISFMGYETYFHPKEVVLSDRQPSVNVGKVQIAPGAMMMEEVQVRAERTLVEYQLDKRVVNVDKNLVSSGGTATDVLEQVPSVSVDNDGNVSLRGSSNVKVLINGRPYELMGNDLETLLEQIPASSVESVEVITNPSAKYDPEGMSGIINIKLKDKTSGALGLNGVVNLNIGTPLPFLIPDLLPQVIPTSMGSISLNYTTEKYNLFFTLDGGMRNRGSFGHSNIERLRNGAAWSHDT
ncbi:MAG: TonB-dependent receptor, partial [Bacteroidales bacterium]|nr:TonB-dependent receptor [Bacteroidales bacterium]